MDDQYTRKSIFDQVTDYIRQNYGQDIGNGENPNKPEETPAENPGKTEKTPENTITTVTPEDRSDAINAQYDALDRALEADIDRRTAQSIAGEEKGYGLAHSELGGKYRDATAQLYRSMDNQALTDRLSGRRGGIAGVSLSHVEGAYQAQRMDIARRQLAIATSAAQQIETLRAQGEFDKADALLQNSQQRLQALFAEANRLEDISREEARRQEDLIREEAHRREDADAYNQQALREEGLALLQKGVVPPDTMLEAMGLPKDFAQKYALGVQYGLYK